MNKLLLLVITIFKFLQGDDLMMAMLFACRVVEGRTEFTKVPRLLKQQVADIIVNDFGLPELVPDEYKGTTTVSDENTTASN